MSLNCVLVRVPSSCPDSLYYRFIDQMIIIPLKEEKKKIKPINEIVRSETVQTVKTTCQSYIYPKYFD